MESVDKKLKDLHPSCEEWALNLEISECIVNSRYMIVNCALSCSKLPVEKLERQKASLALKCVKWAIAGDCIKNSIFMAQRCYTECMPYMQGINISIPEVPDISSLRARGYTVSYLSEDPPIFLFENILSSEECEHLISLSRPYMERSSVGAIGK